MGLLDPATSDGRVIFFLPWQKQTIAGTTDLPCEVTHNPRPTEDEIMFILQEVKNYLNPDVEVRRGDVLSAWSGIRPLVSDPNKPNTQSLARNHIVHVSPTNLVTIAGGKWTTYRAMAQETIDAAIKGTLKQVNQRHQIIYVRRIYTCVRAYVSGVCVFKKYSLVLIDTYLKLATYNQKDHARPMVFFWKVLRVGVLQCTLD